MIKEEIIIIIVSPRYLSPTLTWKDGKTAQYLSPVPVTLTHQHHHRLPRTQHALPFCL